MCKFDKIKLCLLRLFDNRYRHLMTLDGKSFINGDIMISQDYNIWVSYHNEELIKKYNIKKSKNEVLFNTSNILYDGNNLNHLNRFLSEGCCLLYPYLNNLQSKYIGFRHYRRWFDNDLKNLGIDMINKNYIQYFHYHLPTDEIKKHKEEYNTNIEYRTPYKNIENHCFFWSMDKCGIMDDMIDFLKINYPQYLDSEKEIHNMYWACIFVCNWDVYQKLAKFIYDYIQFINGKYKLNWDEKKWYNHVYKKFLEYNQLHHPKNQDNIYCKRTENDGSVWCELPFWGEKGWTTTSYDGYKTELGTNSNLFRVYSYNIEFLVSVFIHNHKHYIDMNNVLYFIDEDLTKKKIEFNHDGDCIEI